MAARPDLLRLESFGAVYYHRPSSTTHLYPRHLGRLLAAARTRSILEAFAAGQAGDGEALSDVAFARQVTEWKRLGIVGADYRVGARLIDGRGCGGTLSAPLVTHVQLTAACNLHCSHCYVPIGPHPGPNELETREVLSLFAELSAIGCPVVVLAGGEPMRRPDLFEILEGLGRYDLDATLCTNATLIDAENAPRLAASALRGVNVSLDGPDAETHDRLRGRGQFARAIAGVRRLVEAGAREVKARVTVTAPSADRLLDFAPLARDLGIHRVVFKPFDRVGVASSATDLFIDRAAYFEAVSRAKEGWPADGCPADFSEGMPSRPPPEFGGLIPAFGCVGGTTSVTVMPDGRVAACGVFASSEDWSLRDRTFAECWRSSKSIERWRSLVGNEQCRTCELLAVCGGGCRARAVGAGRGFEDPDPWAPCGYWRPAPDLAPSRSAPAAAAPRPPLGLTGARRLPVLSGAGTGRGCSSPHAPGM